MTIRRLAVVGALCAGLIVSVSATRAQEQDPRLVTVVYDAARIVRIHGRPGVQATIAFADDEKIENVAVGDSDKWQITPNKRANLLFARPLDPAAATNMTVVTDKRTYLFDLVASLKDRPVYMLTFTYRDRVPVPPSEPDSAAAPPPVLAAIPQAVPPPPAPRVAEQVVSPPAIAEAAPAAERPPAPQPLLAEEPKAPPAPSSQLALAQPVSPSPAPPAYRSAIDAAVGAPPEVLPADQAILRAEADRPGDPKPAPLAKPRRERVAKVRPKKPVKPAAESAPSAPLAAPGYSFSPPAVAEPGALNFAWIRQGRDALLPMRVYDDGRATYLIWGAKQTVPEVEVVGVQSGLASPAITRTRNSIVVSAVPSQIVLRAGQAWATLDNLRQPRTSVPVAATAADGASQ
jgi:type IV secretory pathway VirB9-like protein